MKVCRWRAWSELQDSLQSFCRESLAAVSTAKHQLSQYELIFQKLMDMLKKKRSENVKIVLTWLKAYHIHTGPVSCFELSYPTIPTVMATSFSRLEIVVILFPLWWHCVLFSGFRIWNWCPVQHPLLPHASCSVCRRINTGKLCEPFFLPGISIIYG